MEYSNVRWQTEPVSEFASIAEQWQNLNSQNSHSLLLTFEFVEPLIRHFPPSENALLLLGYDNESLVCATIVEKVGFGQWQTYQPSQAPIGVFLLDERCNISEILPLIVSQLPGVVLTLGITQQDPDIITVPEKTKHIETLDYIVTGRLTVPANFEDYWKSRSKNSRQNVSKANNRLVKEGIDVSFVIETDKAEITKTVVEYGEMESSGWKAGEGKAININNAQGRYYVEMLSSFAPEQTEIWRYFYNDELVATDLCIHDKETIILLKTTFNENYSKHSPAFCMHVDGIKHAIDKGYKTIEFYGPAMQWHKKLTEELRSMYHITWHNYPNFSKLVKFLK